MHHMIKEASTNRPQVIQRLLDILAQAGASQLNETSLYIDMLDAELDKLLKDPFTIRFKDDIETIFKGINLIDLTEQRDSSLNESSVLANDSVALRIRQEIYSFYRRIDVRSRKLLKGALGFFLFVAAAESAEAGQDWDSWINKANYYLQMEETTNFLFEKYQVPKLYRHFPLLLHRVGSTSYILKYRTPQGDHVLKIIKYFYLDNQTIANATKNYKSQFLDLVEVGYSPFVYMSNERFVIMDFIPGISLREYIARHLQDDPKLVIKRIRSIAKELCSILSHFAQRGIFHLNLSPENILVKLSEKPQPTSGDKELNGLELLVIDFGSYYLLNPRGTTRKPSSDQSNYLAPELSIPSSSSISQQASILADIYSLGIILLEMFSSHEISIGHIYDDLESIRLRSPRMAELIEEMIDPNPETRLFEVQKDHLVYEYIKRRIDAELQIYERVNLIRERENVLSLRNLVFPSIYIVISQMRKFQSLVEMQMGDFLQFRRLLWWSLLSELVNMITVCGFLYLLYKDFLNKTMYANLPGRVVALSFSLLATKYYLNIFSTLSTTGIQSKAARLAEFFLRLNSFGFSIPTWYTLFVNPKAWPICVALGSIMTVANNFFTYRLVLESQKKVSWIFGRIISKSQQDFLLDYRNWYKVYAIYAMGFGVLGVLLMRNLIRDEWFYACIVIVINLKMFKWDVSADYASWIRTELEKSITSYSRALRYLRYKDKERRITKQT